MRSWIHHGALALVLLVSVLLRVELVRDGGQYYWPDEIVYDDAKGIVAALAQGDYAAAITPLNRYGPMLFKVLALVPASIERLTGDDSRVPGLFFAMFSVCNIALVGLLARGLGASHVEALLASTLTALSSSWFYFSRHLLPYDVAMTIALVAVNAGVRSGASLRGCFASGVLAACTFFAYNGYWSMALAVPLLNAVAWPRPWRDAAGRALVTAAGVATMGGLVFGASALAGGGLLQSYRTFGSNVIQGDFAEGWSLPFEYLWHAEHGLLVLWLASVVWIVVTLRRTPTSPRVRVGLAGLAIVFAALAVSSTLLHTFVVYGRLARPLIPFFCLVAAFALEQIRTSKTRAVQALVPLAIALLVGQAAVNFEQPLKQTFPDHLERQYGPSHLTDLIWVNVEHIYPEPRRALIPEEIVLVHQAPHPLQFLPYQYEGYTPAQRRLLRTTDIRMRIFARIPTP
jgi:hypothetical protein